MGVWWCHISCWWGKKKPIWSRNVWSWYAKRSTDDLNWAKRRVMALCLSFSLTGKKLFLSLQLSESMTSLCMRYPYVWAIPMFELRFCHFLHKADGSNTELSGQEVLRTALTHSYCGIGTGIHQWTKLVHIPVPRELTFQKRRKVNHKFVVV